MSALKQFNNTLRDFVDDLKKLEIPNLKNDIIKLDTFIDVTKINARAIIPHFQTQFLRDEFVKNILKNNVYFFVNYDATKEELVKEGGDEAALLVKRVQNIIYQINKEGKQKNIESAFKYVKIMCFHAYTDLNIDPTQKFRVLMQ